jgi:hypothetical protein
MTDENTHTSPDNAPEESAKTIADTSPSTSTETKKREYYHATAPHHFKWNVEVRVDGHDVYHGFVKDITMYGLHLFLEHNLQYSKLVKLHIHVPPLDSENPHHILEVTGKITATIYDSSEDFFRSSIEFLEFTFETDREYLKSRIANY